MHLATTAAAGSELLTALAPFKEAEFRRARAEARRESFDAYAADALVALACAAASSTEGSRSNAKAILVVDVASLRRGSVERGETCEIRGVGPVSVDAARRMLGPAALAVVVKDGVDVRNVTHLRRRTNAHQRTVLEYQGLRCTVEGCDRTDIEIDHRIDWAMTHRTRIEELDPICHGHHQDKTRRGHALEPGTGRRRMLPPDHPDLRGPRALGDEGGPATAGTAVA